MKPKPIIFICLLLLAMFVLTRCKQNGLTNLLPPGIKPADSVAAQWFPNRKGDSWTYQVTDTVHHATLPHDAPPGWSDSVQTVMVPDSLITGTLKITVLDTTTLRDGSKAMLWQNEWPQNKNLRWERWSGYPQIDSSWVVFSADSVKQYAYLPSNTLDRNTWIAHLKNYALGQDIHGHLYIFPVDTGNSWRTSWFRYKVISKGTITVPAGTFNQVYQIQSLGFYYNSNNIYDIWFKQGVGVLQAIFYQDSFGTPIRVQTWKLKSYHLK